MPTTPLSTPSTRPFTPHGRPPRGLDSVPRSTSHQGAFGRIFRNLPPFEPDDADLVALAATMIEGLTPEGNPLETDDASAPSNNPDIPAGYTYLGQFLDHDLTFDPNSLLQRDNDPDGVQNFRTPKFDLDSLYGSGPDDSPYLYADGVQFLLGPNDHGEIDLPRNSAGRGLTGDPRNDENVIISQLHLAFLEYHNAVVDEIAAVGDATDMLFEDARQVVRWHYQWLVLHDFLTKLVGQGIVDDILKKDTLGIAVGGGVGSASQWKPDLKFYAYKVQPFIPVEFSVAAYRFGHSQVRANYALNFDTAGNNSDGSPKEIPIFDPKNPDDPNANDLRGFRPRPADRTIDWFRFFFDLGGLPGETQLTRTIDTQLSHGLGGLPTSVASNPSSLAARNLLRGKSLGLPSGQDVAREMGIPEYLIISTDNHALPFRIGTAYTLPDGTPDPTVPADPPNKAALELAFGRQTPLWYYILKEAELLTQGRCLGPVGGRIVAEVFIGLMAGDSLSFLNREPDWRPKADEFGCTQDGVFTIMDLIKHVQ